MIKAWGPLFALMGLFGLVGTGLFLEHSKPYNHGEPSKTENRNSPSGESKAAIRADHYDEKGSQEKSWYKDIFDKPTDWLLAIFTGFLVLYTRKLYQTTDGLVKSTNKLWESGERQLQHLTETAERQLRAYVFPIEARLTRFSAGEVPECKIVAFNSGQTPAYRLTHVARFVLADFPLKEVLPDCRASEATSTTNLAPQAPLDKLGAAHWLLSETAEVRLRKGEAAIYLYGRIDFFDAFGRPRWVKYRYMTGGDVGFPREGRVGVCRDGNETSEG